MISLKHKFLFVHVPKTAGQSIQSALRRYSEAQFTTLYPSQDGVETFGIVTPGYKKLAKHSPLRVYKDCLGPELYDSLFKFACIRNPWDMLISAHFSPHWGEVEWDRDVLAGRVIRARSKVSFGSAWFGLDDGAGSPFDNLDYIMRFEHLNEDFEEVCDRIGIPHEPLPMYNRSEHQHYATYHDAELVELVRVHYADVIERFGYTFEEEK